MNLLQVLSKHTCLQTSGQNQTNPENGKHRQRPLEAAPETEKSQVTKEFVLLVCGFFILKTATSHEEFETTVF